MSVFLPQLCQTGIFFSILDRKEGFLDQKSELLESAPKSLFSKGVSPWFLSKNRTLSLLCLLDKLCKKKITF